MKSPPTVTDAYLVDGVLLTDGAELAEATVAVADGHIEYAGPSEGLSPSLRSRYTTLPLPADAIILPGLIDLHCHGAVGGDFPGGDTGSVQAAVEFLHRSGTTTLLGSLVTADRPDLLRAAETLRPLAEEGLIAGIHAEGPFLASARCGAQDPRFLLDPDIGLAEELVRRSGGHLRTMTYAPELPDAAHLVKALTRLGVTPSLGHTDADAATAAASLTAAASDLATVFPGSARRPTVTHLFNGMPPLHHRTPGPVSACLRLAAEGVIAVELIADGVHLDPETVRMVFSTAGAANILLVTDSMSATGLPDGDYELGPAAVRVSAGEARLKSDNSLAGGTATLLDVVRRTVAAGVSPAAAVLSATAVPAGVLGLGTSVGSLRAGMKADVLVTDGQLSPVMVMRAGKVLTPPTR